MEVVVMLGGQESNNMLGKTARNSISFSEVSKLDGILVFPEFGCTCVANSKKLVNRGVRVRYSKMFLVEERFERLLGIKMFFCFL